MLKYKRLLTGLVAAAAFAGFASTAQATLIWDIDKAFGSATNTDSTGILSFDFAINGDGFNIFLEISNTTDPTLGSALTAIGIVLPDAVTDLTITMTDGIFQEVFDDQTFGGISQIFDACVSESPDSSNTDTGANVCKGLGSGSSGLQAGSTANIVLFATIDAASDIYLQSASEFESAFSTAVTSAVPGPGICARFKGIATSGTGSGDGEGSDTVCAQLRDTPTPDPTSTDVPEPGTLALFGFGLLSIGAMARRRRKVA